MNFYKLLLLCLTGLLCIHRTNACLMDYGDEEEDYEEEEEVEEEEDEGVDEYDEEEEETEDEEDTDEDEEEDTDEEDEEEEVEADCGCDGEAIADGDSEVGPDCKSKFLKDKMDAELAAGGEDTSAMAQAIQDSAVAEFGGEFQVICGAKDFAYQNWFSEKKMCKTSSDNMFCLAWKD